MTGKPFKPPSFIRRPALAPTQPIARNEPPLKKRRVSTEDDDVVVLSSNPLRSSSATAARRKPLVAVRNPALPPLPPVEADSATTDCEGYYNVLWRKFTAKKHKTWDGDGILVVHGGFAYLQDISGREMGKTTWSKPLLPRSELAVGGKEIEVDSVISKADYLAGRMFLQNARPPAAPTISEEKKAKGKSAVKQEKIEAKQVENVNKAAPTSTATKTQYKNPMMATTVSAKPTKPNVPVPRHDPLQKGALVMKRPTILPRGKQAVDVVVDPILCKHLRDHQRQGVSFLYECVMGMRSHGGEGAVLADEMGLGKTLQTIALIWTLLKQNPIYEEPPVVRKALIVCPVTLINNWRREFRKWLGRERIGVFIADGKFRVTDFTKGRAYNVMVIGYEKLRTVIDDLKKCTIDIVIADEGHRLKTAKNKSAEAIKSLNTERRVILSGTPVQNDLTEFFVMIDFVNPGLLGKYSTFKKEFEGPIVKSRQPEATKKEIEKGEGRSKELAELTGLFILRRTAEILSKYLPPKTEYVLFVRPTPAQTAVYRSIISSPVFSAALGSTEMALQLINILKKVCNSPSLLKGNTDDEKKPSEMLTSVLTGIPTKLLMSPAVSAKIRLLDTFLEHLRKSTDEKVILVSNYTSTLDILERLLTSNSYQYTRLDGTTPTSKRQDIVDRFNNTPPSACFAFLLSAKSGGAGLNLIGASRLILFDIDWNPATDLQAMARIHRDGQKKPCRIYRFLVKGALDEKIYQRQLTKMGLADAIVDNKASMSTFSREELRDLFTLDERPECQTHTLLSCDCEGKGNLDALAKDEDDAESPGGASDDVETITPAEEDVDDDESLPDVPMLLKANQVNMAEQEKRIKEGARRSVDSKSKSNVRALMQYLHIDANNWRDARAMAASKNKAITTEEHPDLPEEEKLEEEEDTDDVVDIDATAAMRDDLIDDEVLRSVLQEPNCFVDYIFAKTTG